MAKGAAPRKARFVRAAEFQPSFDEFAARLPKIGERLRTFLEFKEERPPRQLPKGFYDHALNGRLEGLSECHLDGDACLIYTDHDDVVTLICVIDHSELKGPRERSLGKRLKRYISWGRIR